MFAGRQEPLPAGPAVVARHVAAIGGEAAFAKVSSIRARGRFEIAAQGVAGDFELLSARPARLRHVVTVRALGRLETGYDGRVAWSVSPISGPEILAGRQLSEAADDAWFDGSLHAAGHVRELTTIARTEFDGRPAFKLRVVLTSGNEQTEYFDTTTGLQLGSEAARATPQGIVDTVNIIRGYGQFGPLKQPTVFVQRALGFEQVMTVTSYEYNVVPDGAFDPPAEVKALLPR